MIETTLDVWKEIRKTHPEMIVYSSYSAPNEFDCGGEMYTSYGFSEGDYPVIAIKTIWDIDPGNPYDHLNKKSTFWFCCPQNVENL